MTSSQDLQVLSDKIAIQELLNEYCLRLEVNDFEEWLKLFTEDAVYEVYGRKLEGHAAIRDMLSKAPHGIHFGGPWRITVDGDMAETIQSYSFEADEPKYSNTGWYHRTAVRTPNGWRFSYARVQFHKRASKPAPAAAAS